MTYQELIKNSIEKLRATDNKEPVTDVKFLLEAVSGFEPGAMLLHRNEEVPEEKYAEFEDKLQRLINQEPLSYIVGTRWFYGLEFEVNKNVLIPRQDTEHVTETAIEYIKRKAKENPEKNFRVLDMCTGSGCIAITVKKYLEKDNIKCAVDGADISEGALETAKINADKNNVSVTFIKSDMFENISEKYDVIISNPPYIPDDQMRELEKKVVGFEPYNALYGGEDGLDFYRIIADKAGEYLKEDGALFLEIGFDQGYTVPELLKNKGYSDIEVKKDYSGHDRVVATHRR